MKDKDLSKLLSLVLRHQPGKVGITLDEAGWASVDELLQGLQHQGLAVTRQLLAQVVATNNKQRFSFSEDLSRIRANQGHSLPVDLGLTPALPPEVLYHGTSTRFVAQIKKEGLKKQNRQHVHLSTDAATAIQVGRRHGQPFLFLVKSGEMHRQGQTFYLSENKVWLTEYVAPQYLEEYIS